MQIGLLSNLRAGRSDAMTTRLLRYLRDFPEVATVETSAAAAVPEALAALAERDIDLLVVNGGDGTVYRTVDLTGAPFPADGILVIATSSAAGEVLLQRDLVGSVDWQNGPDAVQLRDPGGTVVDALQYGDAGTFSAGEGTPAPLVAAGESLSRDSAGSDTDITVRSA